MSSNPDKTQLFNLGETEKRKILKWYIIFAIGPIAIGIIFLIDIFGPYSYYEEGKVIKKQETKGRSHGYYICISTDNGKQIGGSVPQEIYDNLKVENRVKVLITGIYNNISKIYLIKNGSTVFVGKGSDNIYKFLLAIGCLTVLLNFIIKTKIFIHYSIAFPLTIFTIIGNIFFIIFSFGHEIFRMSFLLFILWAFLVLYTFKEN